MIIFDLSGDVFEGTCNVNVAYYLDLKTEQRMCRPTARGLPMGLPQVTRSPFFRWARHQLTNKRSQVAEIKLTGQNSHKLKV